MISVILPVFNVEPYLAACVNSVIRQTYTDLEILLIDDGSTDRSGMICDAFAEKDSRIRVIHTKNGGLSAARNMGIDIAAGDWISFADSDDVMHPEMLSRLIETAEMSGADLCKCDYIHIHSRKVGKAFLLRSAFRSRKVVAVDSSLYLQQILNNKKDPVVWGSIIRREVVRKCKFDEGHMFEDISYQVRLAACIEKAEYISDQLYGYRQRAGSITKGQKKLDHIKYRLSAYELRNRYVKELFPDLFGMSKAGMMTMLVDCHIVAEDWDTESREEFEMLSRQIRKRNRMTVQELADRRIQPRRRLLVGLSMLSMPLACQVKKRLRR